MQRNHIIYYYTLTMEDFLIKTLAEQNKNLLEIKTLNGSTIYGVCNPANTSLKQIKTYVFDNYSAGTETDPKLKLKIMHAAKNVVIDLYNEMKPLLEIIENIQDKKIVMQIFIGDDCNVSLPTSDDFISSHKFNEKSKKQIFVRTLTGRTITIPFNGNPNLEDIKYYIWKEEHIPMSQQRLIFAGKQLEDEVSVNHYHIKSGSVLHLVLRLRGGMYHETSGRNGNYGPLENILFEIEADL